MIGNSPGPRGRARADRARSGPTAARVLITGRQRQRQGTGGARAARCSPRAGPRPFIEVNCAAIPSRTDRERAVRAHEGLLHRRRRPTGAGKFEQADGGTLFLDEIGDLSLAAQAKLLRVLQEGVVTRVGGTKSMQRRRARARGHQQGPARGDRSTGRFREDLLYRLNVVPIHVPAAAGAGRRHSADLVAHFAEQIAAAAGVPSRQVRRGRHRRACSSGHGPATCASCGTPSSG